MRGPIDDYLPPPSIHEDPDQYEANSRIWNTQFYATGEDCQAAQNQEFTRTMGVLGNPED